MIVLNPCVLNTLTVGEASKGPDRGQPRWNPIRRSELPASLVQHGSSEEAAAASARVASSWHNRRMAPGISAMRYFQWVF